MNEQINNNYNPNSLAIARIKLATPKLFKLGGVLIFLISLATLLIIVLSTQQNRDNRSKASESNDQPVLVSVLPPIKPIVGQNAIFQIELKPQSELFKADGIQLTIRVPKNYFSSPQIILNQNSNLIFAPNYPKISTDSNNQYYLAKIILLNKTDTSPIDINSQIQVLQLTAVPRTTGQTSVDAIEDTVITKYKAGDQVNYARIDQSRPFEILADQSGTQSSSITFPYKLQGLTKAGVEILTNVWILPIDGNQNVIDNKKSIQKQVIFKSDTQGWLRPLAPIDITELVKNNTLPQNYLVQVKTPVSLRKNIGNFELVASNQAVAILSGGTSTWSGGPAVVGDFVQVGNGYNVINLFDINAMLQRWTDLSVAINESNKQFDVNFDNILNVMDVGLIINNWTELDGLVGD